MTFLVYLEPSRSAATWKWLKNLRHDLLYLLVRNYPTPAPSAGRYTVWLTCHLDWLSHMREVMGRFYQRQCVGWPSPKVMAVITGTSVPICCNLRIRLFYASLQNTVAQTEGQVNSILAFNSQMQASLWRIRLRPIGINWSLRLKASSYDGGRIDGEGEHLELYTLAKPRTFCWTVLRYPGVWECPDNQLSITLTSSSLKISRLSTIRSVLLDG